MDSVRFKPQTLQSCVPFSVRLANLEFPRDQERVNTTWRAYVHPASDTTKFSQRQESFALAGMIWEKFCSHYFCSQENLITAIGKISARWLSYIQNGTEEARQSDLWEPLHKWTLHLQGLQMYMCAVAVADCELVLLISWYSQRVCRVASMERESSEELYFQPQGCNDLFWAHHVRSVYSVVSFLLFFVLH